MRVLITGGAGFLGSHLCDRLIKKNYQVICLDNFSTGKKDNIKNLIKYKNFEIINGSITNKIKYKEKIDQIYNLACPASPPQYQKNPVETIKVNFIGALNVLDLGLIHNSKILQASTSEIYGDPIEHPQKETYWGNVNPIGFRSCYDEGKRAAETLFFDYNRQYKSRIRVVRIFNTYGPNMDMNDGRVISNFICQSLQGKNITIYGKGMQTRSFCYVDDLIHGLISMMNNRHEFIGPVNLGNPKEATMIELAKKIINLTGSSSKIIFKKLPKDDPKKRKPSIKIAKLKLNNWQPKISLDAGLKKTIKYFDNILKNTS